MWPFAASQIVDPLGGVTSPLAAVGSFSWVSHLVLECTAHTHLLLPPCLCPLPAFPNLVMTLYLPCHACLYHLILILQLQHCPAYILILIYFRLTSCLPLDRPLLLQPPPCPIPYPPFCGFVPGRSHSLRVVTCLTGGDYMHAVYFLYTRCLVARTPHAHTAALPPPTTATTVH